MDKQVPICLHIRYNLQIEHYVCLTYDYPLLSQKKYSSKTYMLGTTVLFHGT